MKCICWISIIMAVLLAVGCGKQPRKPQSMLDTPAHHAEVGLAKLDKGAPHQAQSSFDVALELDPDYGPALAGKGIALAAVGNWRDGSEYVEDGLDEAADANQELFAHVAAIRAMTWAARNGELSAETLLDESGDAWEDGMKLVEDERGLDPAPLNYYRGEACLQALETDCAETMFSRIISATPPNAQYAERAEARWRAVQMIRRAALKTNVGIRIALTEQITRADMAALLVEELDVGRFYEKTEAAGSEYLDANTANPSAEPVLEDVAGHPLRADIEAVTRYGVRGLQPFHGGQFKPDVALSKAEGAMILEDIIVRASGDDSLATRYIGRESPFVDVRPDHPFFNAVMLVTTRGLLATNARQGRFDPLAPLSGAEAALAVSALKTELNAW